MASYFSSLPGLADFFPPTPRAYQVISNVFKWFPLFTCQLWIPSLRSPMGRSSITSRLNMPGRYAWAAAEVLGPLYLLSIMFTLPSKLHPSPSSSSSLLGTGLPIQHEVLGMLYVVHYLNRSIVTPLFLAPSMSPIHAIVTVSMSIFQLMNSGNIACWIVYSALAKGGKNDTPVLSPLSILGLTLFFGGLTGNIIAENTLFSLRRGAAKRKAKSQGKATITYDKVYTIPPAEWIFKYMLYPHYVLEWVEWTGFWVLGGAWGLGWGNQSAAMWFVIAEISSMLPRAVDGRRWYEGKFGKKAVAGRAGALPGLGL